jgi:hypothetical protein
MGCYACFVGRCAKCGEKIEIEIQEFDLHCAIFLKGETVYLSKAPDNFEIDDTKSCRYCGYINTIVVKDRIFKGFDKEIKELD